MNTAASSDEKMMAALAHGSVILAFVGPIIPVLIWSTQRKKSKFIAFHALQAMGYQAFTFWLWMLIPFVFVPLVLVLALFTASLGENSFDPALTPFILQIFIMVFFFGLLGLFFLTGIVGAVFCLMGREFRYPLMGKWLENFLSYQTDGEPQLDETKEDHWVAGICHATAILQLWGVLTPLIVWFSQKERSIHLQFQAMQAAVYQILAFVVYLLGMVVYMVFFFGMFLTLILGGAMGNGQELQGPPAFLMVVFFVVMMLFWLVIMILMPLYYLLAGIASLRVTRGHHFRYPILGKIVEERMGISRTLEVTS